MKAVKLNINPFQIISIEKFKIAVNLNRHIEVEIEGFSSELDSEIILKNNTVYIEAEDENEEKQCLFQGMVTKFSQKVEGELTRISIHASSFTILLESEKHVRFFQDTHKTFRSIVEKINQANQQVSTIYGKAADRRLEKLVVQYEETDWEFLIRIASMLETYIVPDCIGNHICYYFGLPQGRKPVELDVDSYEINAFKDQLENKSVYEYVVESREILSLCTPVIFMGNQFLISGISGEVIRNELVCQYHLRHESGLRVFKKNNKFIAGVSVPGRVIETQNDRIRVDITCDEDIKNDSPKWFYFATVYSSPNGVGWYCMPEIGDIVHIHFPDYEESHCYAISSVHLEDRDDLRTDPDVKFIRTAHDKEVRFEPERIVLTNHKGLSIVLDDNEGIFIKSNSSVCLSAEIIELESGDAINMLAKNSIVLKQNHNSIVLHNGIRQNGFNIKFK